MEVGRKPCALVGDLQDDDAVLRARIHPHRSSAVPQRVVDEVLERLLEPPAIAASATRSAGAVTSIDRAAPTPRARSCLGAQPPRAARATTNGSVCSASCALVGRASTRRSSARRTSRSTSSVADRRASSSSACERGRRVASSSSVCRVASGVRSSWLASATKRRSRASLRPAGPASRSASRRACTSRRSRAGAGGVARACPPRSPSRCRRMSSTGRNAAPATTYPIADDTRSAIGRRREAA